MSDSESDWEDYETSDDDENDQNWLGIDDDNMLFVSSDEDGEILSSSSSSSSEDGDRYEIDDIDMQEFPAIPPLSKPTFTPPAPRSIRRQSQ